MHLTENFIKPKMTGSKFPIGSMASLFSLLVRKGFKMTKKKDKKEPKMHKSSMHVHMHRASARARVLPQKMLINSRDQYLHSLKFSWRSDFIWLRCWGVLNGNTLRDTLTNIIRQMLLKFNIDYIEVENILNCLICYFLFPKSQLYFASHVEGIIIIIIFWNVNYTENIVTHLKPKIWRIHK